MVQLHKKKNAYSKCTTGLHIFLKVTALKLCCLGMVVFQLFWKKIIIKALVQWTTLFAYQLWLHWVWVVSEVQGNCLNPFFKM